jgi:hypothetical protein
MWKCWTSFYDISEISAKATACVLPHRSALLVDYLCILNPRSEIDHMELRPLIDQRLINRRSIYFPTLDMRCAYFRAWAAGSRGHRLRPRRRRFSCVGCGAGPPWDRTAGMGILVGELLVPGSGTPSWGYQRWSLALLIRAHA